MSAVRTALQQDIETGWLRIAVMEGLRVAQGRGTRGVMEDALMWAEGRESPPEPETVKHTTERVDAILEGVLSLSEGEDYSFRAAYAVGATRVALDVLRWLTEEAPSP